MRRIHALGLLCVSAFWAGSIRAQDCGVWLPGPKPPDFPFNKTPVQLVKGNDEIFARVLQVAPVSQNEVWRFAEGVWTLMPWDRVAFGEPEAITFENNQLAVAARRTSSGGGLTSFHVDVRIWNGTSWDLFGSYVEVLSGSCTAPGMTLHDVTFLSNAWYVSGEISGSCGSGVAHRILPVGSARIAAFTSSPALNHLESFNGAIYLAGRFDLVVNSLNGTFVAANNIARFNGLTWDAISTGANARIVNMFVWQENPVQPLSRQLVIVGKFSQIATVPATGIAALSSAGNWNALGAGISWPPDLPFGGTWLGPAPIATLPNGPSDNDLVVMGMLSAGGGVVFGNMARWTGSAWESFGSPGLNSVPRTLTEYEGEIIAGGSFTGEGVSGGEVLFHIGRFDGERWRTLSTDGTNDVVHALFVSGGIVFAGGNFTSMDGVPASHVAANVAGTWETLGSGVNGPVFAIISFGGETVVGGSFSMAGGVAAQNVAAWNGATWRALGLGLDGAVEDFAIFNNQLVAVGEFQSDDGQSTLLPGVAVWNGTNWIPLHDDIDATEAHAVAVHNNQLYIGGGLDGGLVRFTGSSLEMVDGGLSSGAVRTLVSLQGSLYVGGEFLSPVPWLVRWTGSQFVDLTNDGAFANFTGPVFDLAAGSDRLFVAGAFEVITGKGPVARRTAYWDGVHWHGLGDDVLNGPARTIELLGDEVWAGGEFIGTEGGTVSAYIARRSESPVFSTQPLRQDLCTGDGTETAEFTAAIVADAGATFQWQRNDSNVTNSLRISGATTTTLSIFGALPGDAGDYRLRATDECGNQSFSEEVPLTFDGCCPGDLNNDAAANLVDADLFSECLGGPGIAPPCGVGVRANTDDDSDVDLRDAAVFQRAFGGHCEP